jgi:hypothetical protein
MSVLVVQRIPADTAQFEAYMAANTQLVEQLSGQAKAGGCRAHRFAVGQGEVIVVDEWDTPEQFETFISSPEIQQVIGQMGAQGEPEVTFAESKGLPGEF